IWASRCGSLASSGLPVAVIVPSTTQLLEPRALRASRKGRERSTTEERRKGGRSVSFSDLRVLRSSVVESVLSVLGKIVSPFAGYGGNNSRVLSIPTYASTS